ncbi:COG1741 Pirin-related protein [Flavobacteriaceae bacterium]
MRKQISVATQGKRVGISPLNIQRIFPNKYVDAVGPFVFLDYVAPIIKKTIDINGMGAHPHRGIATLTYIVQGEVEHFDSAGNTGKIYSGGVQWMKAGNGIIHDEIINYDSQTDSKYIYGFQFWINLPAKNKAEKPQYIAIQTNDVPRKFLFDNVGWIKVVVGSYEELNSIIPNYSEQFLYHIHLYAKQSFSIKFEDKTQVAAFLPTQDVVLNNTEFNNGDFVEFDNNAGEIEFKNNSEKSIDIILFGGEKYTETIVAVGPFVMNSVEEIEIANRDFHAGKYGKIEI